MLGQLNGAQTTESPASTCFGDYVALGIGFASVPALNKTQKQKALKSKLKLPSIRSPNLRLEKIALQYSKRHSTCCKRLRFHDSDRRVHELPKLILASGSPRRRASFKPVDPIFDVVPSHIPEERLPYESPTQIRFDFRRKIAFKSTPQCLCPRC